jgi:hypothetical protein
MLFFGGANMSERRKNLRERNKKTRVQARSLLRGHLLTSALLLLAGAALSVGLGLLPALLDLAANQTVAALPAAESVLAGEGVRWGRAGLFVLALLLMLLLPAPLRLGREAWYFGAADGRNRNRLRVLYWLQPGKALRAMRFRLTIGFMKLGWAMVFLLPGCFLLGGTIWQAVTERMDLLLFLGAAGGGLLLLLLGGWFFLLTVQRYFLVAAALIRNPRCKLRNALRFSAARMDGHCRETLRFRLGLTPWWLLSLLIVPGAYALPYTAQCTACRRAELMREG